MPDVRSLKGSVYCMGKKNMPINKKMHIYIHIYIEISFIYCSPMCQSDGSVIPARSLVKERWGIKWGTENCSTLTFSAVCCLTARLCEQTVHDGPLNILKRKKH